MPNALITTKRKFHKILDSISNASSTSLATHHDKFSASATTLPASMDPPAKKPRVARPTSAYTFSVTTTNTKAAATAPPSITMSDERKGSHFAPWDRGQFLERLKTYRHVDRWMGKPERVNEVQWAKRGWSCVGKERVRCVGGCGKEIVITLETSRNEKEEGDDRPFDDEDDEDEWREKTQEQLVEKYSEMIITSHETGCLWRRRGCDDVIQRLPLAHQATAIANLRQRYDSLLAMASELPPDPSTPENFDVSSMSEQLNTILCSSPQPSAADRSSAPATRATTPDPSTDATSSSTINSSALSLALFGWQAEEGHIAGLATCTACFRRLGLWLFKASTDSSSQASMDRLDVVGEHRDYCPWINPLSQNGTASRRTSLDGLAGWQVLWRGLNARTLHKRYETAAVVPATPRPLDDTASEVVSVADSTSTTTDKASRDEKDKERWAKLKRLKQVFHVKTRKGKDNFMSKDGSAIN